MPGPNRQRTITVATGVGTAVIIAAAVVGSHLAGSRPSATPATRPEAPPVSTAPDRSGPAAASAVASAAPSVVTASTAPTVPTVPTATVPTSAVPTTMPQPLAGRVVVLDPGHDGGNFAATSTIDRPVWNGREMEACDTTGSETDSGYTESRFNFLVATLARADLEAEGATVILTRPNDTGVGPCITERTAIGNQAHADAVVSIHADGGPPSGRGFAILLPVDDGINDAVVGPSTTLGIDLRNAFLPATDMPISDYDGIYGLASRDDLAGVNLTTVPKVFIECGNLRNATDAALLTDPAWQVRAAQGFANGITEFLAPAPPP
jgi:N-acetylmuramoyl-L-alanine amidase